MLPSADKPSTIIGSDSNALLAPQRASSQSKASFLQRISDRTLSILRLFPAWRSI
jgi:hypothetical protein